jgi:hypothetical protein
MPAEVTEECPPRGKDFLDCTIDLEKFGFFLIILQTASKPLWKEAHCEWQR